MLIFTQFKFSFFMLGNEQQSFLLLLFILFFLSLSLPDSLCYLWSCRVRMERRDKG